ncbi:ATP-binding protein [Streptomyces sp. NPDC002004]
MDPMNRGADEFDEDANGDETHREEGPAATPQRPPRDALTPPLGQGGDRSGAAYARTVRLVAGDFLLTVNPVDGSEIELCPPGEQPAAPAKHGEAERTELRRAAQPPVPPGPALPRLPLLERQEERERLVGLLARGRSVRLTGPSGSGRTALLDVVAEDCADLAPDGVIRLSGHRRTVGELLRDLAAAVYDVDKHRPDRPLLLELVRGIGAVVVLDDLEFGGAALGELLEATPECAFVVATTPDVPGPSDDESVEEVVLGGLGRSSGVDLLERAVGRALTEEEENWAGDLWFESEGLPLRFVQAGALLRQRDRLRTDPEAFDEYGYFGGTPAAELSTPLEEGGAPFTEDDHVVPLPSVADGAAPAALLASRLSSSARATLRFAVALGGEVPHQAHLPALVGDTHADAALAELVGAALVTPVGPRYRLASGVRTQLEAAGFDAESADRVETAAQHYAWWAGHPSVTPQRVCAEADAVLAALSTLVPATTTVTPDSGEQSTAVKLARAAAPAFAAGLDWGAWERTLRSGQEAARLSGEVGDAAYFHHELGVLALCGGQLDRARAELEASIALRGALADKRGTVAGRRALALVADRSGGAVPGGRTPAGEEVPAARYEESASPPGGVPAAFALPGTDGEAETLLTPRDGRSPVPAAKSASGPWARLTGARRNVVAAGAGALLAAVLGTVVTLGATSDQHDTPSDKVGVHPAASQDTGDDGLGADKAGDGSGDAAKPRRTDPGKDGLIGTSDDPTPARPGTPTPSDSGSVTSRPTKKPTGRPSDRPTTSKPPTSKPTPTKSSSPSPTKSPSPTPTPTPTGSSSPSTSTSASGSTPSSPAGSSAAGSPSTGTPGTSGPAPVI